MTREARRYDELAARLFVGEGLTPAEQREFLRLSASDALFAAEQRLLDSLRGFVNSPSPDPRAREFAARVLEQASRAPERRLRLVEAGVKGQAPVRPRPNSIWLAFAASVAAGLLVLGALIVRRQQQEPAPPQAALRTSVAARAELVFASGSAVAQNAPVGGKLLEEGAVVETGSGQACFTVDPGIDVCLSSSSRARITTLSRERIAVQVEAGLCIAKLSHRPVGQTFSLTAPGVVATAKGTTFAVDLRDQRAGVVVLDGTVQVSSGDKQDLVPAGRHWAPGAGARSLSRDDEAKLSLLLAPRDLWRQGNAGMLAVRGREGGLEARIDGGEYFTLPLETFLPIGKRRVRVRRPLGAELEYEIEIAAGQRTLLDVESAAPSAQPEAERESAPSALRPERSPKLLLERARLQLKAGRVQEALAGYAELQRSFPSSPEARTVLPTMGKLALERQNPSQALGYFDAYLRTGGPLGQEALSGRVRALRALGRRVDERKAIELFRARYPTSLESGAMAERLRALTSE